jgi:hypothetical protein
MTKKFLFFLFLIFGSLIVLFFSKYLEKNKTIKPVEPMPIVGDDPYAHLAIGGVPIDQRDEKFRKWLCVSIKISVQNASGSGTIIFYDTKENYAYVQSCGHLWSGNMNAEDGAKRKLNCDVITWYHNETKLDKPKSYKAEVLFYFNDRGKDCSLVKFKPDWVPNYFPISPPDFNFNTNVRLHSLGCDGGREVAHYDVRYLGERGPDIVTTENSPRPGRSGGGLMSEDFFIGICWGTTDIQGNGNGLFTPLKVLREINEQQGFGWLNEIGSSWARKLPIIDRNNPQGVYPEDYIPLPKN